VQTRGPLLLGISSIIAGNVEIQECGNLTASSDGLAEP